MYAARMEVGCRSRFLRARSYRMVVRGSACRAANWTSCRSAPPVEQQRAVKPLAGGAIHRTTHGGRQRDQNDLATLAPHPQSPVAVFLTEVVDRLEDPQIE